ncbi:hypothetical protein V6Z11_D06G034600 [Gossypium hirsutum]
MKSCSLLLLCSSSVPKKEGRSEMNCWTQRDALSREALQRYMINSRNTILGHLSPLKAMALSATLFCFPLNALPKPPDITTAAISVAGILRDSTKSRALCPKDGPTDTVILGSILLGPFPFISLITIHKLSNKFHHLSLIISSSLVIDSSEANAFLTMKKIHTKY